MSLEHYARKRIPRGRSLKEDGAAIRVIEKGLKTQNVAGPTSGEAYWLMCGPKYYWFDHEPSGGHELTICISAMADLEDWKHCLRRFFGSLATAVEYLHSQKVHNIDIKPDNILVNDQCS